MHALVSQGDQLAFPKSVAFQREGTRLRGWRAASRAGCGRRSGSWRRIGAAGLWPTPPPHASRAVDCAARARCAGPARPDELLVPPTFAAPPEPVAPLAPTEASLPPWPVVVPSCPLVPPPLQPISVARTIPTNPSCSARRHCNAAAASQDGGCRSTHATNNEYSRLRLETTNNSTQRHLRGPVMSAIRPDWSSSKACRRSLGVFITRGARAEQRRAPRSPRRQARSTNLGRRWACASRWRHAYPAAAGSLGWPHTLDTSCGST